MRVATDRLKTFSAGGDPRPGLTEQAIMRQMLREEALEQVMEDHRQAEERGRMFRAYVVS